MGTWLYSLHIRSHDRKQVEQVAKECARSHHQKFLIGPSRNGWVAVLMPFQAISSQLGAAFAARLPADMLEFSVADDDDFTYTFYSSGERIDQYQARRHEAESENNSIDEANGRPELLSEYLSSPEALRKCTSLLRKRRFTFESERLRRFAKLIGLSFADYSYRDVADWADRMPDGKAFIPVPDERRAIRAERRKLADVYQTLRESGLLIADVKPPREEYESLSTLRWSLDSAENALTLAWARDYRRQPEPTWRLAAPWRSEPQEHPLGLPDHFVFTGLSSRGRYVCARTGEWLKDAAVWDRSGARAINLGHAFRPGENVEFGISSDEERIWVLSGRSFTLLSPQDGRVIARRELGEREHPSAVSVSGSVVLLANRTGDIKVLDGDTLALRKEVFTHRGIGGQFDPASADYAEEFARVCASIPRTVPKDVSPKEYSMMVSRISNPESFNAIGLSRDGQWLATGSTRGLKVWRWRDFLEASPDVAPEPAYAWNARPGNLGHHTKCWCLGFDPRHERVVFGGLEGVVEILDLKTGTVAELLRPPELLGVVRLEFSPDGRALIVESREFAINSRRTPELRLWDYVALCRQVGWEC